MIKSRFAVSKHTNSCACCLHLCVRLSARQKADATAKSTMAQAVLNKNEISDVKEGLEQTDANVTHLSKDLEDHKKESVTTANTFRDALSALDKKIENSNEEVDDKLSEMKAASQAPGGEGWAPDEDRNC